MARLALLTCLMVAVAGCSLLSSDPPVLVIANRSDATLALYPTAIVGPCTTLELDQAAIDLGKAALDKAFEQDGDFESWVPAGAIQIGQEIPPQRSAATDPMTVVYSSLPLRAVEASIPAAEPPACAGQPAGVGP